MNIPNYVEESHKVLWPQFRNWCINNGIGDDEKDMEEWWNCFLAGATTMYLKIVDKTITV